MGNPNRKDPSVESEAKLILKHLDSLGRDEMVDASHDMDRALQGQGYGELPLWLRRF